MSMVLEFHIKTNEIQNVFHHILTMNNEYKKSFVCMLALFLVYFQEDSIKKFQNDFFRNLIKSQNFFHKSIKLKYRK